MGLTLLTTTSCSKEKGSHRHRKEHFVPVTTYHCHDANHDDLWVYMMLMNNNGSTTYYTVSSPTPISNFSSSSWTATPTPPPALVAAQADPQAEVTQESVAVSEFDAQLEAEINDNAEYFEGMTTEEMGDYEGGSDMVSDGGGGSKTENEAEAENESDNNSEAESSSESSEGSSDGSSDGGGDSGGGDGGGGE